MKKLLVLILAILIAGCQRVPEESCMAVEFTQAGQGLDFGTISAVNSLYNNTISISMWMYPDNLYSLSGIANPSFWYNNNVGHNGQYVYTYGGAGYNRLYYYVGYSGTDGTWRTATDTLVTSQWQHIVITYDGSGGVTVNPIMYIDGVSKSITELATPDGTIGDPEGNDLSIGSTGSGGVVTPDGKIQDVRIYNRILSQTEISTLYNSRCQRVVMNGLVFWAPLTGASGTQSFDGLQLSYENIIPDVIGGAQGFPYGGPVGRASTIQTIGGQ